MISNSFGYGFIGDSSIAIYFLHKSIKHCSYIQNNKKKINNFV